MLSGLAIAVVMLFYKNEIFGDMHFLLIVPFLLTVSGIVIYPVSYTHLDVYKRQVPALSFFRFAPVRLHS